MKMSMRKPAGIGVLIVAILCAAYLVMSAVEFKSQQIQLVSQRQALQTKIHVGMSVEATMDALRAFGAKPVHYRHTVSALLRGPWWLPTDDSYTFDSSGRLVSQRELSFAQSFLGALRGATPPP
jgi:hypothetical protein